MSRPDETDWRERRDRFFEARRAALEAEIPLPFHAVNVQPCDSYYVKNPCPDCGGRMFPDWKQREGWSMKCICCSRERPINYFERVNNGKKGGRPKTTSDKF